MKPLSQADQKAGGKAYTLGRLVQAGFRVPYGCYVPIDEDLVEWTEFPVAVRSSAVGEDGAEHSFAGQFDTVLNVADGTELKAAVAKVRGSFAGAKAYPGDAQGGSVILQRMVAARVAGVVFTRDPTALTGGRIEAAPGLGDALVSGHVRPTSWSFVDEPRLLDGESCLSDAELRALWSVACKIRDLLGEVDVEFAFDSEPQPWILQARPITTESPAALVAEEVARLRKLAEPRGTVWSRYSLAETLPAPLPMTWSVVQRMMSGQGGYGRLYRDLGFEPDARLNDIGVLDLICGRPYYNLSREARLYFGDFPYVHNMESMRADLRRASYPAPEIDLTLAPPGFWPRFPGFLWKMFKAQLQLGNLQKTFARRFTEEIVPTFKRHVRESQSLEKLGVALLLERLRLWVQLVCVDFAADSLKASAFAALAAGALEKKHGGAAVAGMLSGVRPLAEADMVGMLQRGASLEEMLAAIGHRGPNEMELAEPRWREIPERLRAECAGGSRRAEASSKNYPPEVEAARRWLSLRETSRHWLMLGWSELRRILLALDETMGLDGGIFWLTLEELTNVEKARPLIARRKRERKLLLSVACPAVIFSDDLEAIGRRTVPPAGALEGTPLSWGMVEGHALVVGGVEDIPPDAKGYILVCPSTDPGYTLAMTRSVGLIVETGGVLSHGAIVARELGIPAVSNVNLQGLRSGMRLRVDGQAGTVERL